MKSAYLSILLLTGVVTSNSASAAVGTATAIAVATIPAIIENAVPILEKINPSSGTVKEDSATWCIANEWKTRDKAVKEKGLNWDERAFSVPTKVGGFIKGATWYCYVK